MSRWTLHSNYSRVPRGIIIYFYALEIIVFKQYSLIFVQVTVTGILARGLPPDLRASEYGE